MPSHGRGCCWGRIHEAEAKLHDELDAVLGGRLPTLDDLPQLRYTEMVLAESMRLYPPAWAMGRQATCDVALGPYLLPAGTYFFFSQYIIQRSAEHFPDPLRFDPDRFTPERKAGRSKFVYFPFGAGSRQCIGEAFAWMEGDAAAGHDRAALAASAGSGPEAGGSAQDHAASEVWYSYGSGASQAWLFLPIAPMLRRVTSTHAG